MGKTGYDPGAGWPARFHVQLRPIPKESIGLPVQLVPLLTTERVRIRARTDYGREFALILPLTRWIDRGKPRASIRPPRELVRHLQTPCGLDVTLELADPGEGADAALRYGVSLWWQPGDAVEFNGDIEVNPTDGDIDSIGVPAYVVRGVPVELWSGSQWMVRIGGRPEYPTKMRFHQSKVTTHTPRVWLPIPRRFVTVQESAVPITLYPATTATSRWPIGSQGWDWAFFTGDQEGLDLGNDELGLGVYGSERFRMRRYADSAVALWVLGAHVAEGQKTGHSWSFANVSLPYLRALVDGMVSFGILRDRLRVEVRRTYEMSDEAAIQQVSTALAIPVAARIPVREEFTAGVAQVPGVYGPDSDGQLSANIIVSAGLQWQRLLCTAAQWIFDHYGELSPDRCVPFALGYLLGDGTVRITDGARPAVGLCGPENEVRAVANVVARAFGWEGREWYGTQGPTDHSMVLKVKLDPVDILPLLRAGGFAGTINRAKLLVACEGQLDRHLAAELADVRRSVGGNEELFRAGSIVPGRKCRSLASGTGGAVSGDILAVTFDQGRPMKGSSEEAALADRALASYRAAGFPEDHCDDAMLKFEFERLREGRGAKLEGQVLQGPKTGLTLLRSYHPEIWDVRYEKGASAHEVWADDAKLRRAIVHRIRFGDDLRPRGVRDAVDSLFAKRASVLRPTIPKFIFNYFKPRRVVDPCAGWGSRMIAAMAVHVPYVGIDPHARAMAGNERLLSDLRRTYPQTIFDVDLRVVCAEDVLGQRAFGDVDLVFTSPPYFDWEHYSDEASQSDVRYETFEEWTHGFMRPLVQGAYTDLVSGGRLVLNIRYTMADLVREAAAAAGFVEESPWTVMTPRHHFGMGRDAGWRGDPLLIFRK